MITIKPILPPEKIQNLQVIQSANQIENAATEDVSQTDVDDDLEVIETEYQIENTNDDLRDNGTAAESQVAKLKYFWENL